MAAEKWFGSLGSLLKAARLVLAAAIVLASPGEGGPRMMSGPPRMQCPSGTFVQFQAAATRAAAWADLVAELDALGTSSLYVQWTVHERTAFLSVDRNSGFVAVERPPLLELLRLADERGFAVWVGLIEDPQFWTAVASGEATADAYLRGLRQRIGRLLSDLRPLVARHRSFAGWYISQEIDDVNWRTPEAHRILVEHLRALTRELRGSGAQPVAISAFSNGVMSPNELGDFWTRVLTATEIDVLLFQDGIGTGKLDLFQLPHYLQALNGSVERTGRSLRAIVETFTQTSGPPIDDREFRAEPAPLDRIRTQVELAARYSTAAPVIFSAPDYMVPSAGPRPADLFRRYTAWRHSACL